MMLFIPLAYIIIFAYVPMYGIQLAFREVNPIGGLTKGEFIGLANFRLFFSSYMFERLLKNTIILSLYQLAAGFPMPIILAICINEIRNIHAKKLVQTITYAPYFISVIVLVSIMQQVFSPHMGIVNNIIVLLGGEPQNFMSRPENFRSFYVWSGVWQNMGYNAVIYIAALAGIDPGLHEAAMVDGASRWKRILHVDLPGIIPTIVVLLILNCGRIMNVGFEKAYLMQNNMNTTISEIISTYVYKIGLLNSDYGFATAVGLFNSVINFVLIVGVNTVTKKLNQSSLW
jgi:putative aldouronate transport system permease protein